MRTAFMQVMFNILNQGSAEQFARIGEEGQILQERYETLLSILVENNMCVSVAFCDSMAVSDIDDVAQVFLNLFATQEKQMNLIKIVVENEVNKTDSPANLFRRNSIATRLLTTFAKSQGQEYLLLTLKPLIEDLVLRTPNISFEMDPSKMVASDNSEKNLSNLLLISQNLIDAVIANVSKAPTCFREICSHIATVVGSRFPEAKVTAVGGFIFLRFFCPAIVAPESVGLVDSDVVISKDLRRSLVLITKVVQNLANNVLFGAKESFMGGINDLLRENIGKVHGFLREISVSLFNYRLLKMAQLMMISQLMQ